MKKTNRTWKRYLAAGAAALAVSLTFATNGIVSAQTPTAGQSVPLGGATSAEIKLDMDFGELTVGGGAAPTDLVNADFEHEDDDWAPEVSYEVTDGVGKLEVNQPGSLTSLDFNDLDDVIEGDIENHWDVRLNDSIPLDLSVDLDTGEGDLTLGGLDLRTLDVNMEVGDLTVDLTGDWSNDLDATIDGQGGRITLRVPGDVGVRITADADLGSVDNDGLTEDGGTYVNDAFGTAPVSLRIDINNTVGEVNLEVVE